ncbi:MAG TPA: BatD family protein [bacterium]|nr:BatD family protein [bacterium]
MLRKILLAATISLAALGAGVRAFADEPTIEAYVDESEVEMGDTLTLTVEIRGGSAMTTPDIPPLGNFDVIARSSTNAVEIVNGEMSVSKTFLYMLSPRRAGEFSIGPVKVHIEGREYSAGAVRVRVNNEDGSRPSQTPGGPPTYQTQPNPFPSMPFPQMPSQRIPQQPGPAMPGPAPGYEEKKYETTFVTAEVDRKAAYVGQQVLYTFRLYTAVSISNAQLSLPEFKDFFSEELIKERKFETQLGGRRYAVNEWRFALFPTKPGSLHLGETQVRGMVPVPIRRNPFDDPFFQSFGTQQKAQTFSAPPIDIEVKPLPAPPADFTGLVGSFAMSSSLSKESVGLGETTNLKIEISGKGNLREATLPELKQLDYFKVYPSKPEVKLDRSIQGLSGRKTFEYALVAERPGTTQVPAQEFSYFNPEKAAYEKLSTASLSVHILGSPSSEQLVTAGLDDAKAASGAAPAFDLRPIKAPAILLYTQQLRPYEKAIIWTMLLGAPAFFFGLLTLQRYKANSEAHAGDRKRSRAFRKARASLQKGAKAGEADYFGVSRVMKEYFSDRYGVKGEALTPVEIEDLLRTQLVPVEVTRRTVYFLEQLDLWRYGGMASSRPSEKQLKEEAVDLLREIEKAA